MIYNFKLFENKFNNIISDINKKIKSDIIPLLSNKTEYNYETNKSILINDIINKLKFKINISKDGDKIEFECKNKNQPSYEFDLQIEDSSIKKIINLINKEIIELEDTSININDTEKSEVIFDNENVKSKINNNLINIDVNVIKKVLEDAYILDQIDLLKIDIDSLINRMIKFNKK